MENENQPGTRHKFFTVHHCHRNYSTARKSRFCGMEDRPAQAERKDRPGDLEPGPLLGPGSARGQRCR